MTASDVGILVLRLVIGLTMAGHGSQKAFGWWKGSGWAGWKAVMTRMGFVPEGLWAGVAIGAELVGGLFLAVGFLTPLATMALIGQSTVIILKAHWPRGFWNRDNGFEFPLSLLAGIVAIVGAGAGALSLDAALGWSWSPELRILLAIVGLLGGLGGIAVTRLRKPTSAEAPPAPQPPPAPAAKPH
ncbi:MAG TPA: DoxX family protein [Candidatus Limnocylindrales bacterium]